MNKLLLALLLYLFSWLVLLPNEVQAQCRNTTECQQTHGSDYVCVPSSAHPTLGICQQIQAPGAFGVIKPPAVIEQFGSGRIGISQFFNNLISLIYVIASIAVIFMLLWGSLEWILSGGDKEKLAAAQQRLTHAIIGIVLLAITFAVLQMLGIFTGFQFFVP